MRGYSSGSLQRGEINLAEAVNDAIAILEAKRKKKGTVVEHENRGDVTILGYAAINQVLLNVIDNAIDAAPVDGGEIQIRTFREGPQAVIEVQDNGPGIRPDVLPRIFDPFMTTKPPGEGTGLGLYISKDIVELQHNGKLEVSSVPEKGACFTIRLPREAPEPLHDGEIGFHGTPLHVG